MIQALGRSVRLQNAPRLLHTFGARGHGKKTFIAQLLKRSTEGDRPCLLLRPEGIGAAESWQALLQAFTDGLVTNDPALRPALNTFRHHVGTLLSAHPLPEGEPGAAVSWPQLMLMLEGVSLSSARYRKRYVLPAICVKTS